MKDQPCPPDPRPESAPHQPVANGGTVDSTRPPPGPAAQAVRAGEPVPVNQLTPEEQMALYEKELKENDWGHQPC